MSHKATGRGPTYGEFSFPKSDVTYVKGYARGGKVSQPKVAKVMHEFKAGELHSGSKKGPVVKSRDQAIAIGMSEGRKAAKGMKTGGMASRLDARAKPSMDMPAKSMNPKARMAPRFAKGGMVHPDLAEDKALIKKAFGMHDTQLHEPNKTNLSKLKGGGMATKKYAKGGAVKKFASGGAVGGMAAGAMAGGLGKAMSGMKPMKKGVTPMKKGGMCK